MKKNLTPRALSRVMLTRVFHLSMHLREKKVLRLADLISEFGVCRKTLQADIEFLRSNGHPIRNSRKMGWYYSGPPPEVALSQEELFAILVAEKTVAAYQGTPFEVPLREVFARFSGEEAPVYQCSWDFLGGAITIKTNGISKNDLEVYRRVATAVAMQRVLKIDYRGIRDTFSKRRQVYPVHLCCAGNSWYILARPYSPTIIRDFWTTEQISIPKDEMATLTRFETASHTSLSGNSFKNPKPLASPMPQFLYSFAECQWGKNRAFLSSLGPSVFRTRELAQVVAHATQAAKKRLKKWCAIQGSNRNDAASQSRTYRY